VHVVVLQATKPEVNQAAAPAPQSVTAAAHPSTSAVAKPSTLPQLTQAVQNSWLVKSVLQPQKRSTAIGSASQGALKFIAWHNWL
jgi:hypothetical protein